LRLVITYQFEIHHPIIGEWTAGCR
jgi:hypothetical protein